LKNQRPAPPRQTLTLALSQRERGPENANDP
jgi:hypothetical protein